MLLAVALTAVVVIAGTLATYLYDDGAPLVARLGFGAVTGLAVLALVGFVLANMLGISVATQASAVLVGVVAAALGLRADVRHRAASDLASVLGSLRAAILRPSLRSTGPLVYSVGLGVLLWLAFERVIIVNETISTGYVNNLGDLPFHMQVTASFAYGQNFPPEDPTFAGTGFAYPYMADFLAAMFVTLGASIQQAFLVQNMAIGLALVIVVHRFTFVLTSDSLAALVAPLLILLSGGLGWVVLLADVRSTEIGLVGFLQALPHDYTIGTPPFRWGNAITTLLVTQRSIIFGLPLAMVVFCQLWRLISAPAVAVVASGERRVPDTRRLGPRSVWSVIRQRPEALAAGILTGLLPLIHAHSFIVVMGTAFLLGLVFRQWRDGQWLPWAIYVVAALAVALPEIWSSTRDTIANAGTFVGIELGWDHGTENIAWFWFLNTGLFIPVLLMALLLPGVRARLPRNMLLFTLPFLVWFVVPNVVKLAPWVWDNIKVLFYWYVGFVPLVALVIAWLLREKATLRLLGAGLLASLVLAGSIDVWRVISRQTVYEEFTADGIAVAREILRDTPPRSLILHAPTWNPPVFLTGRRSLMGYTGYIWAHGLDYAPREADIKHIYAGGPEAEALLAHHGVDYVLVSPIEHAYMPVDEQFFTRYTEVAAAGDYRVYQINSP